MYIDQQVLLERLKSFFILCFFIFIMKFYYIINPNNKCGKNTMNNNKNIKTKL